MDLSIAQTEAEIAQCMQLRHEVFVREQGFTLDEEFDALDATATHVLLRSGGQPAGCARLIIDGSTGKIGRVCVRSAHRGAGFGAALIRFGLDRFAATPQIKAAYLSAQVPAVPFYEKLGFTARGETYLDGHVPHIDMIKAL